MPDYSAPFSWTPPGLVDDKLATVELKGAEKKHALAESAALREQLAREQASYEAARREALLTAPRMTVQLGEDAQLGMSQMMDSMGTGAVALTSKVVGPLGEEVINSIPRITTIGEDHHLTAGDLLRGSFRRNQARQLEKSGVSQAHAEKVAAEDAASSAAHASIAAELEARGLSPAITQPLRVGQDVASSLGHVANDPTVLFDEAVSSIPTLALGPMGRLGAGAEAVELLAGQLAKKEGVKVVSDTLRKEAGEILSKRGMALGTGLSEGAGAYSDAAGAIANAPIEQLAQKYPDVAKDLEAGVPEEVIRDRLQTKVGAMAAVATGVAAAGLGHALPEFNMRPLGEGVGSVARAGERVTHNLTGAVGEFAEEGLQSGSGALAGNLARAAAGEEDVDLGAGVGDQMAHGALSGLALASHTSLPSTIGNMGVAAGGAVVDKAVTAVKSRIDAVKADMQAPVEAQRTRETARRDAVADEVGAELQSPAVADSNVLDPELKAKFGDLTQAGALSRVVEAMETETDEGKAQQLLLFGAKTQRELRTQQASLAQAAAEESDPEKKQHLESLQVAIHELVNNDAIVAFEKKLQDVDPALIQQAFDDLPAEIDTGDAVGNPKVMQSLEFLREVMHAAPDKITTAQAERLEPMFQNLGQDGGTPATEQDMAQLQLVKNIGAVIEQHAAAGVQIKQQFPNSKTSNEVRNEILDKGFETGEGRMPSLREHIRDISQAVAAGNMGQATVLMDKLAKFASDFHARARAFDDTAKQALDEGRRGEFLEVKGARTLDKVGALSKKNYQLKLNDERSRETIDHVFADSNLVNGVYNTLAQQFPEIGFAVDGAVDQVPTWTKHTPAKISAPAPAAPAPSAGPDTSTTSQAPAEAPADAVPARAATTSASEPASTPAADPAEVVPVASSSDESSDTAPKDDVKVEIPAPAIDFADQTNRVPAKELKAVLDMPEADYLAAVNPEAKVTEVPSDETIDAELDDIEPGSRAVEVGKHGDVTLMADGNFLYAVKGDQTVGLLAHAEDGSQLYVHSDARGTGLGKAMMRELLIRKPLAMTNGLSEAAQKTRLSVLRDLREELNPTMGARFPTLGDLEETTPEALAEKHIASAKLQAKFPKRIMPLLTPATEALRATNQWLKAFSVNRAHRGLMSQGGLAVAEERINQVPDLLDIERQALGTITQKLVPGIVKFLDRQLQAFVAKDPRALGKDSSLWHFEDKLSLQVTNYGRVPEGGKLAYDPTVAEGLALASSLWVMEAINRAYPSDDKYIAQFLGKSEDQVLPAERAVFQEGQIQDAFVTELARYLPSVLGLTTNLDAPGTSTDGIPQALAADVINVLLDQGDLIQREHFTVKDSDGVPRMVTKAEAMAAKKAGENIGTFFTLSFDRSKDSSMLQLRKDLGPSGVRALSSILDPDREQEWQIGEPRKSTEKKIRGSDQNTSPDQKQILDNQNAVGFYRNTQFVNLLMKLGKDQALELFGYQEVDLEQLNAVDAVRVDGINKGLARSWDALVDWNAYLERQATARDVAPESLPTHFTHYLTSNNRVMMEGAVNPQSNKLLREAMVATRSTMELGNAEHEIALRLMVGQALGLKIENAANHALIAEEVEARMAEGGDLHEVWTAMAQEDFDSGTLMNFMRQAGFAADGSAAKAFHALQAWATYDRARIEGVATVEIHLAFEQDGKTDGPANAMAQLGLHDISETLFDNLDRSGYLLNRERTALGDVAGEMGDLYGAVANGTQERFRNLLAELSRRYLAPNLPEAARFVAEAQGRGLAGAARIFGRLGSIKGLTEDSTQGNDLMAALFTRNFAKQPVTSTGYSGGVRAIAGALSKQVQEHFYEELSKALANGDTISEQLAANINALITTELFWSKASNGKRYLNARTVGKPIDFSDREAYLKLELKPYQVRAMNSHLREGMAKLLRASIKEQMDSTLEGMDKVVTTAQVQTIVLQHEFEKAYQAKLAELIAAGELLPEQSLSRSQEKELLQGLKSLAPITQFLTTADVGDRSVGLNMAQVDRGTVVEDAHGKRKVASIAGGLSTGVSRMGFQPPGVRAAALTVISAGDATMMANYFGAMKRQALNVWDGLEVGLSNLFASGSEINKAVYDAWQFDLLGGINAQFKESLPALQAAIAADEDLERKLEREFKIADEDTVAEFLERYAAKLEQMAEETRLTKEVLSEMGLSIDHMAGARQPFVKDGVIVPREALVAYVLEQVQLKRKKSEVEHIVSAPDVAWHSSDRAVTSRENKASVVALMDARLAASGNKVQRFVWNQIKPLLADNLVVHHGDATTMLAKMREVFPDAKLPNSMPAGAYLQNHVFVTNNSTETLLHELIHATVTSLIDRAYADGKGLTVHQKQAVQALETLASEFLGLDLEAMDPLTATSVQNAQHAVEDLLDRNDVAGAVNEFLAWSLSSREIALQLQVTKAPTGVIALAKKVLAQVRKLLGLPNNETMESFLEQTLGQFVRLTRVGTQLEDLEDSRVLFQLLGQGTHDAHLEAVFKELGTVLSAVPPHLVSKEQRARLDAAIVLAEKQRDAFLAAGFQMTKQEQMVFEMAQAMFATGLQLDPRVMTAMQHLHAAAVAQFSPADFQDDPQSTDQVQVSIGQARYNTVLGNAAVTTDQSGRSTLLPNFIALALVNAPLRAKLDQITLPKAGAIEKNANAQLREWTTRLFDRVTDASLGINPNQSQKVVLDTLVTKLSKLQVQWARTARTMPSHFEKLEQRAREGMATVGDAAGKKLAARQAAQKTGGINGYTNLALNSIRALTKEDAALDFGEDVLATTASFPKVLRDLFAEIVGGTTINAPVHKLLNQARSKVAQVRQRLREEAPVHVRAMFTKPLSDDTWGGLVRWVGKTDLQALLGSYLGNDIQGFLEDQSKLDTEIATLEGQLSARPEWLRSVEQLSHYLMTGEQLPNSGPLYRNATAIARQVGYGKAVSTAQAATVQPVIDHLVTLKSLAKLDLHEKAELARLFREERAGIEGLVKLMRQRVRKEQGKHHGSKQRFNQWKGYVPVSMDPRRELVLASASRGAELVKRGYVKIQDYIGDVADPSKGLAYYAITSAGGRSTYNQGALQTVEGSVMGVDHLTGRTLDNNVKTLITEPKQVARITHLKMMTTRSGAHDLLPVFDEDGQVKAYERPLSKQLLDQHLRSKPDLSKSIGMWMGRQAEEEIAQEFNSQVVGVLKKIWDDHSGTNRAGDFVDITDPKGDLTLVDTWNTIPRETQTMLRQEFGGAVMVRKDMINNALGYRSASIGDAFTGMTDLPESARATIELAAYALLGKGAYKKLVAAERTLQGLIGHAKDVIVVRSGVVALANGIANQFQLVMHGVPVHKLAQIQAQKIAETETYLRNAHRVAAIQVELDMTTRPDKRAPLEREMQSLHDLNRRLTIWPLIAAGELPAIAEGLTEHDEYTLVGDGMNWLENKAKSLPEGVVTAFKYATISKDTALYQGLNRMIQFGDFMAKAALYDHLVQQQGMDPQEALRKISERFVNYNLLAGRSRDYLESIGLTWFMNYKIRIQKIALSTLRENPLRFLLGGIGADWMGADSLISSSAPMAHWSSAIGPGQFWRAESSIMWNQLIN